jgi:hypothetical protein
MRAAINRWVSAGRYEAIRSRCGTSHPVTATAVASVNAHPLPFVRPRWIGSFVPATRWQIGIYLLCVVGEVGLIRIGTQTLTAMDQAELRPALVALVVGVHFLPFAWAFGERMFYLLGGALILLGGTGLLTSSETGALAAAVGSGLVMSLLVLAYSLGMFAGPASAQE